MRKLIVALMLVGVSSCGIVAKEDTVRWERIDRMIRDKGYTTPMPLPDRLYYRPTLGELKGYLNVWAEKCRMLPKYRLEVYDCDEFTDEFKVFMKRVFYLGHKESVSSLAIFNIYVCTDYNNTGRGHAFSLIVTIDEGIVYVEPMDGTIIKSFIVEDINLVYVF